ncbi:MAG: DUF4380 domain-containing protein [Roseibium sp.]|uniref:hypothetical protein n=1 Tax=Roseibium sp. TaxID=1936156 RepID=UPI0026034616|nr:hypothetical protein [Roseibium sp.]MCV0426983.1 DUF4380 domain-containing protein [Roseibium sp.]
MPNSNLWQYTVLSDDIVKLSLLPGIGGRVMNVHFRGKPLLFENPDSREFPPDLSDLSTVPTRARHLPFPLWGGEKTWIAPESSWPETGPHPVLDSGPYECQTLSDVKVCMTSRICPISGLQVVRTVTLEKGEAGWTVEHKLINHSDTDQHCGIWSVMMVRRPVRIICQAPARESHAIVMGDPLTAVSVSREQIAVSCIAADEFKIGTHPTGCVAKVLCGGETGAITLTAEASSLSAAEKYAHGHALEVYNSADYDYAELEWHAPAENLSPGETSMFSVKYRIRETTE